MEMPPKAGGLICCQMRVQEGFIPPVLQSMVTVGLRKERFSAGGRIKKEVSESFTCLKRQDLPLVVYPQFLNLGLNLPGGKASCLGQQLKTKGTRLADLNFSNQQAALGLIHLCA